MSSTKPKSMRSAWDNKWYSECRACGARFGRGKGVFGLARHGCDEAGLYLVKFFKAGVALELCADALGMRYTHAEALLRARLATTAGRGRTVK